MLIDISCQIRLADDLTLVVHACRGSESASKRAEVDHRAVLPKERVHRGGAGGGVRSRVCVRGSGQQFGAFLTAEACNERIGTTQSGEVLHHSVFPNECVRW